MVLRELLLLTIQFTMYGLIYLPISFPTLANSFWIDSWEVNLVHLPNCANKAHSAGKQGQFFENDRNWLLGKYLLITQHLPSTQFRRVCSVFATTLQVSKQQDVVGSSNWKFNL